MLEDADEGELHLQQGKAGARADSRAVAESKEALLGLLKRCWVLCEPPFRQEVVHMWAPHSGVIVNGIR